MDDLPPGYLNGLAFLMVWLLVLLRALAARVARHASRTARYLGDLEYRRADERRHEGRLG